MWQIEPVGRADEPKAMECLAGGPRRSHPPTFEIRALRAYLDQLPPGSATFWWGRDRGQPAGAALLIRSAGRTGILLHTTTEFGSVPPDAMARLLDRVSREGLAEGLALVQSLIEPHCRRDAQVLRDGGFDRLAELLYMRCPVDPVPAEPNGPAGVVFEPYDAATDAAFRQAIQSSYEESLDCPGLEGLRPMDDVLDGHRSAGIFRPDLWTLASVEGRPAGVILLNQSAAESALEVVYMGLGREFRGRGLGRALLRRAARLAAAERLAAVLLAVDTNNRYALELYRRFGFQDLMRRVAYFRATRMLSGAP